MGTTRRGVPLSFALNAPGSDRAHLRIVGVHRRRQEHALSLMAAQFLRYPGAKVAVFDRGRSSMVRVPRARAATGSSSGPAASGVQPLRAIDRPEEMAWAHGWVMRALRLRGLATTPQTDEAVSRALAHLADEPPDRRTLVAPARVPGRRATTRADPAPLPRRPGTLRRAVRRRGRQLRRRGGDRGRDARHHPAQGRGAARDHRHVPRHPARPADRRRAEAGHGRRGLEPARRRALRGQLASWAREMRKLKAVLALATQSLARPAEGGDAGDLRPDRQQHLPAAAGGDAARDAAVSTRRPG